MVERLQHHRQQSGQRFATRRGLSDVYEDQAEGAIMTATSLFEPVIIIVFGCMILVLVMAIYLPVFSAAGNMR